MEWVKERGFNYHGHRANTIETHFSATYRLRSDGTVFFLDTPVSIEKHNPALIEKQWAEYLIQVVKVQKFSPEQFEEFFEDRLARFEGTKTLAAVPN